MFPIFRAQQRPPGSRPAAALATSSGLRCSTAPAADTSASSQLQQNGNAFIKSSLPANTDASSQASLALKSTSTETCINLDAEQQVSEASDDDEDIIFVKSGKRQVQTLPSKSVSRKAIFGGAAPKKVPVITIPDSPPSKQDSTDGFKPLSELHSAQRAKRKAEQPRLPRWPTFEEHMLSSSASPTIREAVHSRWRTAHASVVPADVNLEVFSGLSRDPGDLLARQEVGSSPSLVELRGSTPSAQPLPTTSSIAIDAQPVLPAIDSTLWTSRYAPKSAADVLGAVSGRSARHLKEWLQELALTDGSEMSQSRKRRRPVLRGRKVRKKRKLGNALADFLASDEDEDDDTDGTDYDSDDGSLGDEVLGHSPSRRSTESCATSVFPRLSNLILLVGPHSSGKTCTVHAVASELGWDVFEVYPGLGKRGAKDIERYVGDVGKNHLVRKQKEAAKSPRRVGTDLFSMLQRSPATTQNQIGDSSTKQSLILLDEVDILFSDEDTFWQGIVHLAEGSLRPIVMTCTDPSLIPFNLLEFQTVNIDGHTAPHLQFCAPDLEEVSPFLHQVALAEGLVLTADAIAQLYSRRRSAPAHSDWRLSGPSHPLPHPKLASQQPHPDLRQALSQLQIDIMPARKASADTGSSLSLSARIIQDDSLSFSDAFLTPSCRDIAELEEPTVGFAHTPKEIDCARLHQLPSNALRLAMNGHDERILEFVAELVNTSTSSLGRRQARLAQAQSAAVLNASLVLESSGVLELPAPLLPSRLAFTDYLPAARDITKAENMLAELRAEGAVVPDASPRLRRSHRLLGREQPQRRLDWSTLEAHAILETAFSDV